MKKIILIISIAVAVGCSVQKNIENDNLKSCGISKIPKEFFLLDIPKLKENINELNTDRIVKKTDSTKITTIILSAYNSDPEYYSVVKTLKNNSETFFIYDSIGRLNRKYDTHTGTNIGEEIKFEYSDAKSTKPIETYRVNYDTIYPICWKEALQIATKKGINSKEVHMDIQYPLNYWDEKKPMEWIIYDEKHIMYVDAFTGKATNLRKKGSGLPTN